MPPTGEGRPVPPLLGRQEECAALDALLGTVRDGLSGALVLVGEPGIGKTRLLDFAAAQAPDVLVARVVGMEAETQLGFAGLHRLLLPFLDRTPALPAPQRAALGAAFGMVAGPPPDRFLVGLAALTLLSDVAVERPLLCLVDDVHWLDRETVEVLAFIGRRLQADGIGMVLGTRDEQPVGQVLAGLPVLALHGLAAPDARRLLLETGGTVAPGAVERVIEETGGNPLALLELGGEQITGPLSPAPLPVGPRMEAHFLRRVRTLPADTQTLLLLISAASTGDPGELWQAATDLGVGLDAAEAAVAAGILTQRDRLAFRHPLIRSAVYGGAVTADRRRVHLALADAAGPGSDQRIWHLAEAAPGLDEDVAAQLERASERAGSRGGYAAQAMYLSRSAAMTPDRQSRTRRLVAAAQAHFLIGDAVKAQTVLTQLTSDPDTPVGRASVQRLRASIASMFGQVKVAASMLLTAIGEAAPHDERLARDMAFDALTAALITREHTAGTTLEEFCRAIRAMPWQVSDRSPVTDRLVEACTVRITEGHVRALPLMRAAVAALCTDDLVQAGMPISFVGCFAAEESWDDRGFRAVAERILMLSRERGGLHAVNDTLKALASCELYAGRFDLAEAYFGEAQEIDRAMGIPEGPAHRVELLAWQGRVEETRAAAAVAINDWGGGFGVATMANHAHYTLCLLELSLGNYPEALASILRACRGDLPGEGNRMLPDVVEAGVRAGDRASAEAAYARLANQAEATATPWALGLLARAGALLAGDEHAEPLYQQAIARLNETLIVTELARAHLLYGEWLRRRKRRADARVQLRTAYDMFTAMGAAGFAERTRVELLATGEQARRRDPRTEHDLTPQERQVAGLAADGVTNAEIATRLYITASTVEYHLNKVFRKLGVTSRRQLGAALRTDA
ncbi:LuxR family transcriptional regulator [Dactylosporangium maewongense]|uniref:LuxR family transcriptional regulator n=1 Tax=Dactylosporangium maewongense TaxID=634393 RepID=A0ABP4N1I4_9ACTN